MARKLNKERIVGPHFIWLVGQRAGVYTADGRTNSPSLGRHSLGTRNHQEALAALQQLDLVMAVKRGLADRALLNRTLVAPLSLQVGRDLYTKHVERPDIVGGARPSTAKRYRAVFDKFIPYAMEKGCDSWSQVTVQLLERYAAWLDGEGYAYATKYLELTTIKQAVRWMIDAKHLPPSCAIQMRNAKPMGTDTYCWRSEEVTALIQHCVLNADLNWLAHVFTALACTGMRISELASLRWSDIDLDSNVIKLTDESTRVRRSDRLARRIKNHRGRSFPIHDDLRTVFRELARTKDGLVFHGPRGGVLSPDIVRRTLIRDVLPPLATRFPTAKGEIGFACGRLHSFRHFFCSACANGQVAEQVVMRWLGHQHSGLVRHYYHLHSDESQRQMQKVSFVGKPAVTEAAG